MKKTNKKNWAIYLLILGIINVGVKTAMASDAEDVFDSEPIDIDGNWQQRETVGDKMAKMRANLEEKTNDMMHKKIEDIRYKEEMKLTKKLQKAFQGGLNNMGSTDEVGTSSSAVAKAPMAPIVEEKLLKVIPSAGIVNLKSKRVDFDTDLSAGVSVESMVSKRLSVGVAFNYTAMTLYDNQNSAGSYYGGYYGVGSYNTLGYTGNYNQREIDYSRMSLAINSKLFLTTESRVKPFVGFGLNYGRNTLNYNDDGNNSSYYYSGQNYDFGGEEYTYNNFAGIMSLGTEISFTDTIGLEFDINYSKSLFNGNSEKSNAYNLSYNPDLTRLQGIGKELQTADSVGLKLGLVVQF